MNTPSQRCFVWCAERKGALPASPVSTVWAPSSTQPKGWTDAMYKGVGDTEAEALADLRTDLLKWDAEHIEDLVSAAAGPVSDAVAGDVQ